MDQQAQVARSRRGDRNAFTDLYDAHAPATWRIALVAGRDTVVAASAVLDATVRVLGPGDRTRSTSAPLPVQLLAVARSAAVDTVPLPSVAIHLHEQLPELSVLGTRAMPPHEGVAAFDRLPERWRTVLWLRHVERLTPAEVATVLGLTEPGAVQLSERAERGLHEQLARAHLRSADRPGCQRTAARLGGYAAGTLEARDAHRVRRHLDRCEACRRRLDDLDDLTPRLHRSIPALPVTLRDLAEQRWQSATRSAAGPLGVRLPNGAMAPAWVERALAGATAAVVGLGITAAVALGARRGDDPVARETAAAKTAGAADGESALGGDLPGDELIDGGSSTIISIDPGPSGGGVDPTGSAPAGDVPGPRGGSAPTSPSGPSPSTPPPTDPPSSPPPTTPPPSTDDPVTQIVKTVGQALEPLPTELCTGVGPVDGLTCDTSTSTGLPKL